MKKNKDGKTAIPKVAWRLAADVHLQAAKALMTLSSLDGLVSGSLAAKEVTRLAGSHIDSAKCLMRIAADTKPGRPRHDHENALAAMAAKVPRKKSVLGAPVRFGASYDITTFRLVEERRQILVVNKKAKPTIRNAADSLNSEIAARLGSNTHSYVNRARNHTLSSYQRGKRLNSEIQKSD